MPTTKKSPATIAAETIARNVLDLETLDTRKSDSLDFHDLAVWQIKRALERAWELGRNSAATPRALSGTRRGTVERMNNKGRRRG